MYESYFGLSERPFSITPDPRFVYLSQRHQDALAHLLYGIGRGGSGGFVQLTGEVGTGKTTLCRLLLEQVPEKTRIALILNPVLTPAELLRAICRELEIELTFSDGGLEDVGERLNRYLLDAHAAGERVVLIIDEAQNMSREALEQVRLLTNLETATDKLLQIILLGQPELRQALGRPSLRQLSQRITARYHLDPLESAETAEYVRHRLAVAGAARCPFTSRALKTLYLVSGGVPRLINIIADRALMAGYARETTRITPRLVRAAAGEVVGDASERSTPLRSALAVIAVVAVLASGAGMVWMFNSLEAPDTRAAQPVWHDVLAEASAEGAWREVAALWPGVTAGQVADACSGREVAGVMCLSQRGNWGRIRALGLPVILRLSEPRGGHVLLAGLGSERITVRQSGQEFGIPVHQAERRWLGEFLVVWPDNGHVLRPGDTGAEVRRLKTRASESDPPYDGPLDAQYSADFGAWVRRFQRDRGLAVDGMLGPATRLYLDPPRTAGATLMTATEG